VRGALALPSFCATLETMASIRERVFCTLESVDLDSGPPLIRDGFVYAMVLQHEYQHNETILQTMQLKRGEPYAAPRALPVPAARLDIEPGAMVRFPGGPVTIGTDDRREAYDNERPAHTIEIAPFWIDASPVTNVEYLAFMEDGGYARRELWCDGGWAWLQEANANSPKYWSQQNGWNVRTMDRTVSAESNTPVCHVCWYEAGAFARWAGKRLPTEVEWEAAASGDPVTGRKRRYPWGDDAPSPLHANLDQLSFGTSPVGAFPRNVSPIGCYGMIGDVWEWTASDFGGHPGFEVFPYREYSEAFFGSEYKVLRGGAWATRPHATRNTFRNWDYPIRRQIFSGFRCASDA
jgi:iron(II)-dependent oxidoreductase